MRKSYLWIAASLLGLAAAASAQTPGSQAPERKPLICKADMKTGSHIRARKVCKTAEEWRALSRDTQAAVREYGRTGSYGSYDDFGKWRGGGRDTVAPAPQ